MKTNTILLLMLFLVSCKSPQRKILCAEINNQQVPPVELCDMKLDIDQVSNIITGARCRCRMFNFNSWSQITEPVNYPLAKCDGVAGFNLDTIAADIRPKVKALYRLKENLCQNLVEVKQTNSQVEEKNLPSKN